MSLVLSRCKKILYSISLPLFLVYFFNVEAFAQTIEQNTVIITGDLVNNSHYPWSYKYFIYPGDTYESWHKIQGYINIDRDIAPAKGRFMFPLVIGKTYHANLMTFNGMLCTFTFKADSAHHATIKLISTSSDKEVICSYSGDPSNNTATITIADNPNYPVSSK